MRKWIPALLSLVLTAPALADTTYTYTGLNYLYVTSPYTTSEHASGTLTFSAPLAANLDASVTPLSFNFSDGINTYTNLNSVGDFELITDGTGTLTRWFINIDLLGTDLQLQIYNYLDQGDWIDLDRVWSFNQNKGLAEASFDDFDVTKGSWSVSTTGAAATPEPETISLVTTGLLGIVGLARRRKPPV